ncbi:8-oxo-dGTP pyrophosphatase MutT (NUDIX family) [Microbacterium foliorum]|uniref:8-oxo-dGTP pyrophosphatase MutT (NUDIX family) n=1 Tax=Microbacterium foliorum TaxID=104336 RepID=A0ABU1HUZ4_9MICO|nr:8-oxo-dGTP pyrophosphatase MutT (NUDIX family) [Microbacterium foliorum]
MSQNPDTLHGARAELLAAAKRSEGWTRPVPPVDGSAHPASVLVLFGKLDSTPAQTDATTMAADLDVLLQRRAATLSSHPGQVSFPGGRAEDADADAVATALREAEEETGLDPAGVEILATLAEIPLAASNHMVTPVLGWWRSPSRVAAVDHAETVDVFRVPVGHSCSTRRRGSRRPFTAWVAPGRGRRSTSTARSCGVSRRWCSMRCSTPQAGPCRGTRRRSARSSSEPQLAETRASASVVWTGEDSRPRFRCP